MGPRLGSRGKRRYKGCVDGPIRASMGPRLGSRGKNAFWSRGDARRRRFNGAATWKSRKVPTGHVSEQTLVGMLQWGRDLEVAESLVG